MRPDTEISSVEKLSLEEMIVHIAGRDSRVFDAFYDRTSKMVMQTISRICRQRTLAEDAFQETYITIWQRAVHYDPQRGSICAWVVVIARSRALDMIRSHGRRAALEKQNGDFEDVLRNIACPVSPDIADRETLVRSLGLLDSEHRNAVLLAYHEGWSREEISRHQGIPVSTVKTRLRRSLIKLRDSINR